MALTVSEYVKLLELNPHPEGGWFKEVYRSSGNHNGGGDFPAGRCFGTAIYFLIEQANFSAFHKILSDEIWHFYDGEPLEVIEINSDGELKKTIVGNNLHQGHVFQYTVPAGVWFASLVYEVGKFSLVGCTVSPGFEFRDFELGSRDLLNNQFPLHVEIINALTRI